ncbi:MAG TPA: uridine phosphorylase [Nitrososphaerales archaeon]|nr:uridine phosphorylase [Nitrososphaerales archaeon]
MAHEPRDESGRPYHVRLNRKDVGRVALLPGDPGRVPMIARRLMEPRALESNREYVAWTGRMGGEKVIVLSTGIGGPSAAIAVEELARLGARVMIRVGTCGAISPDVKVGSIIIADAAVRMDGTSSQYAHPGYPAAATPGVVLALQDTARALGKKAIVGIAASTDSFYVGQGRKSFGGYFPSDKSHLIEDLRAANVLCFEMEAATIFTLGRIFGLKTGALFAVVANRATNEFKLEAGVEAAIEVAVETVKRLKKYSV